MVIDEIISILRADSVLTTFIGDRLTDGSIKYTGQNAIVYNFVPMTDDKVKRTDRLEIHIIATSYSNSLQIGELVRKDLLTIGDTKLTDTILNIYLNGGGTMEDAGTDTKHQIMYFYITSKK